MILSWKKRPLRVQFVKVPMVIDKKKVNLQLEEIHVEKELDKSYLFLYGLMKSAAKI